MEQSNDIIKLFSLEKLLAYVFAAVVPVVVALCGLIQCKPKKEPAPVGNGKLADSEPKIGASEDKKEDKNADKKEYTPESKKDESRSKTDDEKKDNPSDNKKEKSDKEKSKIGGPKKDSEEKKDENKEEDEKEDTSKVEQLDDEKKDEDKNPKETTSKIENLASTENLTSKNSDVFSKAESTSEDKKEVEMEPKELKFPKDGGNLKVKLTNTTGKRTAIKIKCSDNLLYRVNPVFAFIDDGKTLEVEVFRSSGAPKQDKIVVVQTPATVEDTDAASLFKKQTVSPTSLLPLLVES